MKYIDREKIYSDPKLLQYLRENSIWYKNLNRRISVDIMTNEMKEKYGLKELSMGMSNDYKIALQEGATMIRLGRILFE